MRERESQVGRLERWTRAARRGGHRAVRLGRWLLEPRAFPRPLVAPAGGRFPHRLYEARLALAGGCGEAILEAGKETNLALAAPSFDGVVVERERPLSFWRTLGRADADRGFRAGVEIRGGCLIPSVGGGLCLLANVLFAMAVRLGWTILERHGHSADVSTRLPGDPWGLDATVLWPYLDLRVAPRAGVVRLAVAVYGGVLVVAADSDGPAAFDVALTVENERATRAGGAVVREGRVVRTLRARATGHLIAKEIVAENRRRVLEPDARARTCLTCDERSCATGIVALRRLR